MMTAQDLDERIRRETAPLWVGRRVTMPDRFPDGDPFGTLHLTKNDQFFFDAPYLLPCGVSIVRADTEVHRSPTFLASNSFRGSHLFQVAKDPASPNAHANFDTHLVNLCFDCRNRCRWGLLYRGAQNSSLRNVRVRHPLAVGIWVLPGSRSWEMSNIGVQMHPIPGQQRGTAIRFTGSEGGHIVSCDLHRADIGLDLRRSRQLLCSQLHYEYVRRPFTSPRSNKILKGTDYTNT